MNGYMRATAILLLAYLPLAGDVGQDDSAAELQEREQVTQRAHIPPGGGVFVRAIRGPVTVGTSAELDVHATITRMARTRPDFRTGTISVETTPAGVQVVGEPFLPDDPIRVRHRVDVLIPRRTAVQAADIGGSLTIETTACPG